MAVACLLAGVIAARGARAQGPLIFGTQVPGHSPGIELRLSGRLHTLAPAPVAAVQGGAPAERPLMRRVPEWTDLKLSLSAKHAYDDNVLRADSSGGAGYFFTQFGPTATLSGRWGKHRFSLDYHGSYLFYQGLPSENTVNHDIKAKADLDLTRKLQVNLGAGLNFSHAARGAVTSRVVPIGSAPDEYREHSLDAKVTYGRRITQAQIGASFKLNGLRYSNNGQQGRDYDSRSVTLFGRWNYRPRLSFLAQIRGTAVNYLSSASKLDSFEIAPMLGVEWEATAKTHGSIRYGLLRKSYDDPTQQGFSGQGWDARVSWEPRTYSKVSAFTSRKTQESGQGTGLAVTSTYGLSWNYAFRRPLVLDANARYAASDLGAGQSSDLTSFNLGLTYVLNRWITLKSGLDLSWQTANFAGGGFRDRVIYFSLTASGDHPLR